MFYQIINEAQQKGLGEFGKIAGKQIIDSTKAVNQLNESIASLKGVREKFRTSPMITGGGQTLQQTKQFAFQILDELNLLTGEEREKLENTQDIKAALNRATLDALGGSLGAQISDGDRAFIAEAFGQLGQRPEAVVQIYDRIIAAKERELENERRLGRASIQAVETGDPQIFFKELSREFTPIEPTPQLAPIQPPQPVGPEQTTSGGTTYRLIQE